ncbi:hypothetical protein ACIRRH_42865 [Kitasatospora sp. NPDC101235]|uniref:hypothetical protein n=1 Tax=Kitasatospora sp. NPDC101235 TaxID=3364101 RepID=UPI0037F54EA9
MLIAMVHFVTSEARRPLPACRIRRLGERDWKATRADEIRRWVELTRAEPAKPA